MMSQSKFVVALPCQVASRAPSLPFDPIPYVCAAVVAPQVWPAPNCQGFPQPSRMGNVFTYVGARYVCRLSMVTPALGQVIAPAALYLLRSVARASHAVAMVRMSAIV